MIAVGYEGEEEVVEGVWEHWDRNVSWSDGLTE